MGKALLCVAIGLSLASLIDHGSEANYAAHPKSHMLVDALMLALWVLIAAVLTTREKVTAHGE